MSVAGGRLARMDITTVLVTIVALFAGAAIGYLFSMTKSSALKGANQLLEARPEPIDDVVARLVAMGAKQIGEHFQGPNRSVQMLDPENNEFCVH